MGVTFAAIAAIVFNKSNKHRVYPHREQEKTHKHNAQERTGLWVLEVSERYIYAAFKIGSEEGTSRDRKWSRIWIQTCLDAFLPWNVSSEVSILELLDAAWVMEHMGMENTTKQSMGVTMCGFHSFWTNTARHALSNITTYILRKQFLEKNI